ncbi:MAG: glutamine-hydrolyzing carbamoyl-phosphate synthase small subunit [Pseudomonadota bacterium]
MNQLATLALADGTVFCGRLGGVPGEAVGEVVFNTACTGYQEILSDPSYARQLVTLTQPHIGNTGATPEDMESGHVQAAGLIVRDLPRRHSNWRATSSLQEFLREQQVTAISDVDTRALTRHIREHGAQAGCIVDGVGSAATARALASAREFAGLSGMDLAKVVSTREPYSWTEGAWRHSQDEQVAEPTRRHRVVAFDFGVKRNILRLLHDAGCEVTVVPAQSSAQEIFDLQPQGIFLSNGPGDPEPCDYAIRTIREVLARGLPTFGICLGHQLLGLAAGARTRKMKFGHHGANHPVLETASGRVYITSQNHGFVVDEESLPANVRVSHRSLFDQSLQGIEFVDVPAFGFQGHPEASPGPHDIRPLFERFAKAMEEGTDAASH